MRYIMNCVSVWWTSYQDGMAEETFLIIVRGAETWGNVKEGMELL
jgi:hypothetical protein